MNKILLIILLIINISSSYATILKYVSPIAIGDGSGSSAVNAADFLNTSFWSGVQTDLSSDSVTVNFLAGDYQRAYTETPLVLSNLGHAEHVLKLEGDELNTIFNIPTGYPPVPVVVAVRNCRNMIIKNLNFTGNGHVDYVLRVSSTLGGLTRDILIDNCSWIDIENVTYGATGCVNSGTSYVTYKNCTFKRIGNGVVSHMIYNAYECSNIRVVDSYFEDCTGDYIRFRDNCDYGVVKGNTFVRNEGYNEAVNFIAMPVYNTSYPGQEILATNYSFTDNIFASSINNAIAFRCHGHDPADRNYLLTSVEGTILSSGTASQRKALLLNNFKLNTDSFRIYNNSFHNGILRNFVLGTSPQYGAVSKGFNGTRDIFSIINTRSSPFSWELITTSPQVETELYTSVNSGEWNNLSTWDKGKVPKSIDHVFIASGHTVSIKDETFVTNLTIEGTLDFVFSGLPLTIIGDLQVNVGGVFKAYGYRTTPSPGFAGKYINLGGNLINNGNVDFSYASSAGRGLVLNGRGTQIISGSGTFSPFSYISVDKVEDSVVVNVPISISRKLDLFRGILRNNSVITMDNKLSPVTANFATINRSSFSLISGTPIVIGFSNGAAALYLSYIESDEGIVESGEIPLSRIIHQLKIDNALGLQLKNDLTLSSTSMPLVLTNGVITIDSGKTILCLSNPVDGSENSFINGALAVRVNSTNSNPVNFPVGSIGNYRKITFGVLKSVSGTSILRVACIPVISSGGGTVGSGIGELSNTRRWESILTSGSGISYQNISINYGSDDGSALKLIAHSSSINGVYNALPYGDNTSSSVTTTGTYNSTGYFALATSPMEVLSTQLAWFEVKKKSEKINLSWNTSLEGTNKEFLLERSGDGKTFSFFKLIPVHDNSLSGNNYSIDDNYPERGINYYRLSVFDQDKTLHYLGIKSIEYSLKEKEATIYPNPVIDRINISFNNLLEGKVLFSITNMGGKQIFNSIMTPEKIKSGKATVLLDGNLASGVYLFNISSNNYTQSIKFVKE